MGGAHETGHCMCRFLRFPDNRKVFSNTGNRNRCIVGHLGSICVFHMKNGPKAVHLVTYMPIRHFIITSEIYVSSVTASAYVANLEDVRSIVFFTQKYGW